MKHPIVLLLFIVFTTPCFANTINAPKAYSAPIIDGQNNDSAWRNGTWLPLDQLIVGSSPSPEDFSGRFKVTWDEDKIYLLLEIIDDVLFDQHTNPLKFYWDDDCVEIFIDEDASGGNHQFNFNAFAYHVALDNQAVDIGYQNADKSPDFLLLSEHINSRWQRNEQAPYTITWELAISVYDDSFSYKTIKGKKHFSGQAVKLFAGKKLGFMLAYCDNDGSKEREHFIGSTAITPVNGDKNLGYITADVFDTLYLVDNK